MIFKSLLSLNVAAICNNLPGKNQGSQFRMKHCIALFMILHAV